MKDEFDISRSGGVRHENLSYANEKVGISGGVYGSTLVSTSGEFGVSGGVHDKSTITLGDNAKLSISGGVGPGVKITGRKENISISGPVDSSAQITYTNG